MARVLCGEGSGGRGWERTARAGTVGRGWAQLDGGVTGLLPGGGGASMAPQWGDSVWWKESPRVVHPEAGERLPRGWLWFG